MNAFCELFYDYISAWTIQHWKGEWMKEKELKEAAVA
jgi:hypothetical protein